MNLIIFGIQIGLWGVFIYYLIISMFGWFKRKEKPKQYPLQTRFAILIAAHNEELVIQGLIRSLKQVNYPESLYDILVIADNCTDNTAQIARNLGVKVFERFDSVRRGKGYSLEWMFKQLFAMDEKYNAICILDANNLVSPNFFLEMNKQLCLGHQVIQGYLDSKNPHDSWISGNYSIAYWISNRLFQLPRHYLGLNCALGGTGFVMTTDVLKEIGWDATCLTEDLEFSMKLVGKGLKVAWAHEAIVCDEKPLKLMQSWRQRKHWMQGHSDCARRFAKNLFAKAWKDKDMVAFDAGDVSDSTVYHCDQRRWNGFGSSFLFLQAFSRHHHQMNQANVVLYGLLVLIVTYINIVFVMAESKFDWKIASYILIFPLYSLTWIPIIVQGFLHRNHREWVHTLHTRALEITDVEQMRKVG